MTNPAGQAINADMADGDSPSNIAVFIRDRIRKLIALARHTRGELQEDDLISEAWLIARRIAQRRGSPLDLSDPIDQDQVFAWLYKEFVDFADKRLRYAVRLDQEEIDDHGDSVPNALAGRLAAPEASDPLLALVRDEEKEPDWLAEFIRMSYSQASAYLTLVVRMGRDQVARYLVITTDTLRQRVDRAVGHVRRQPSVFDGIERISEDFTPRPGNTRPECVLAKGEAPINGELWPSPVTP